MPIQNQENKLKRREYILCVLSSLFVDFVIMLYIQTYKFTSWLKRKEQMITEEKRVHNLLDIISLKINLFLDLKF